MRLVKLLSSVVTERSTPKSVLLEISAKLKASLVAKFKEKTTDSLDTIGKYIDEFENYKSGLPVDKRDLTKFNYDELKKIINTKKFQKKEKDLFTIFKNKEKGLDRVDLSKTIRKFLMKIMFGKLGIFMGIILVAGMAKLLDYQEVHYAAKKTNLELCIGLLPRLKMINQVNQ